MPFVEVMQEGIDFWSDYLVGLFLDANPSYYNVRKQRQNVWKCRGDLRVHYVDAMYYFKFFSKEERLQVLEAEPSIIAGKPFIITP